MNKKSFKKSFESKILAYLPSALIILVSFILIWWFSFSDIARADETDEFLRDCPDLCLPQSALDDNKIDPNAMDYSKMVLGCSQNVKWNEFQKFFATEFSASAGWGAPVADENTDPAEQFFGLYSFMYYKVKKETEQETRKVVAAQSGLNEVEAAKVVNGDLTPLLNQGMTFQDAYNEQARITESYKQEKLIMNVAAELKGEIQPTELFSNGTIADSGYDLIVDLNMIEDILFLRPDPPDTGMVQGEKDQTKLSTKIIEVEDYKKKQEQCEAIEDGKVSVQGLGERSKKNRLIAQVTSDTSQSLKIQAANQDEIEEVPEPTVNQDVDPSACNPESQTLDNAVNEYFLENTDDPEISESAQDFEEAEESQEEEKKKNNAKKGGQEEQEEEVVTVNGEEMTKEEYEDLKEECETLQESDPFDAGSGDPAQSLEDLLEVNIDDWGACAGAKTEERDQPDQQGGKDDDKLFKAQAAVCVSITFENGPVTPFVPKDNCIACHVDYMIQDLDKALGVNFMTDKASGNLLEPNICKLSFINEPALKVHLISKPVITPRPTHLTDNSSWGINFEGLKEAKKSFFIGGDTSYEQSAKEEGMTPENKVSNLVNSRLGSDAKIVDVAKMISDIVTDEAIEQSARVEALQRNLTLSNKAEFGQNLEIELRQMTSSFEAMNTVLISILDEPCKKMKETGDVP